MIDGRSDLIMSRRADQPPCPPRINIPPNEEKDIHDIQVTEDKAVHIEKLAVAINRLTKVIIPTFMIKTDSRGEPYDIVSLTKYLDGTPLSAEYINYRKAEDVKVEKSANIQTGFAGPHKFDYAYDKNGTRIKKTQGIYIKKFEPAEKLSSDIINELFPGVAASVLRIRCGNERFDGSIMFSEYKPGYVVLHEQYNAVQSDEKKKVEIPKSRPKRAGTAWPHIMKGGICYKNQHTGELTAYHPGIFEILANSLFRGDFDIHTANFVLVNVSNAGSDTSDDNDKKSIQPVGRGAIVTSNEKNSRKEWRQFDFGWGYHNTASSTENYSDPITQEDFIGVAHLHILSHKEHMILGKPTNHFTEIPKKFLFTEPFAVALDHIANHDFDKLKKIIEKNIKDIHTDKGIAGLRQFAKHIGFKIKKEENEENAEKELITKLLSIHKARQGMCRELAFSIRLSQCIENKNQNFELNDQKFQKLLIDYQTYAAYIDHYIKLGSDFHFRGKKKLNKQTRKELSQLIKA